MIFSAKSAILNVDCELEVITLAWSYNRLWVMLIYKGIKRTHLIKLAGINAAALAKMGKNQTVSMDILGKLCEYFDCGIEDIVEYVPEGGEALPPTARSK